MFMLCFFSSRFFDWELDRFTPNLIVIQLVNPNKYVPHMITFCKSMLPVAAKLWNKEIDTNTSRNHWLYLGLFFFEVLIGLFRVSNCVHCLYFIFFWWLQVLRPAPVGVRLCKCQNPAAGGGLLSRRDAAAPPLTLRGWEGGRLCASRETEDPGSAARRETRY